MSDHLPPSPPIDRDQDDELPPCIGTRLRDIAEHIADPDPCAWEEED